MEIDKKLLNEITKYCKLNNIDDVEKEVNFLLQQGFNVERFGLTPFDSKSKPQMVEIEEVKPKEEPKKEVKKEATKAKKTSVRIIKK